MKSASEAVEQRLFRNDGPSFNIPTAINDELFPNCVAVSVAHNSGQGSSIRGMECTQFEIAGQVYNLSVVRKGGM